MPSLFEREHAANGADLGIDKAGQTELLRKARSHCRNLAETFSKSETASNALALSEALLALPLSGYDAANVSKVYCAMVAIDRETGCARSSDFAELTTDAEFFASAKARAGLTATFTLSDRDISRLRGLVA